MNSRFTKWVACWGNTTSITDRKEATYSKNLTLRYPIRMVFDGCQIRLHFSNLTGTEDVTIHQCFVNLQTQDSDPSYIPVTIGSKTAITIPSGQEVVTDPVSIEIHRGDTLEVSLYLRDFTQMNSATLITGPLSSGKYAYGNFASSKELPLDLSRSTNWFYFLNTVDILTDSQNKALICYGDSITAQSWPDYLTLRCFEKDFTHVSIIRRAVSGTRILRQYDCITYQAYGLKGATRFPVEMNTAGAETVIIQHGINDIIHPVGIETNPFRPWSDMPTVQDLKNGVKKIYIDHARKLGLKVWSGTLLPIEGWRTYTQNRETVRQQFNDWLRSSPDFDGCIDFDQAVRNPEKPTAFAPGFDSGDNLHPSEAAYKAMAETVPEYLLN